MTLLDALAIVREEAQFCRECGEKFRDNSTRAFWLSKATAQEALIAEVERLQADYARMFAAVEDAGKQLNERDKEVTHLRLCAAISGAAAAALVAQKARVEQLWTDYQPGLYEHRLAERLLHVIDTYEREAAEKAARGT
jgi:hypothetical protein